MELGDAKLEIDDARLLYLLKHPISSIPFNPPILRIHKDDKEDGDIFLDENPQNSVSTREIDNRAPYIIVVQGPPRVGKSLLIKSLVKHFTKKHHSDIRGPIAISGKKRQLQFVECPDDIHGMIDAAKYADLVLLLIDASYQYQEMETFEFLYLLRVHRFPKVMGVFTHLDNIGNRTDPKDIRECLKEKFESNICKGIKVFHLSGLENELYKMHEIQDLAKAVSDIGYLPSSWRSTQPYVLVDRFEDVTPLEEVQKDKHCNRNICLYGYLRGSNIKNGAKVHIACVGDFCLANVTSSADPCFRSFLRNAMETVDLAAFRPWLHGSKSIRLKNDPVELTRSEIEGFRTGTYLKMEVLGVPSQMVENFDPCHPILVGGIGLEEQKLGYIKAKLRRHNWHMRLLKAGDAITVSSGWRRYQTKPIYAMENGNKQHQPIEEIPEDEYCLAMFWGPLVPPHTRIAVVRNNKYLEKASGHGSYREGVMQLQKNASDIESPPQVVFLIAAEAVVSEHGAKIMLKSQGTCFKISKKTALVRFPPDIDIAEFKGADIRAVTGPVIGRVDKAVSTFPGIAECTFNCRINVNDVVIMHVEAPRFYNPLLTVGRTVTAAKDSLEKDVPDQRLPTRRSVLIVVKGRTNSLVPRAPKYHLR